MMDLTKINMPKFFFFVYNKKNMELDTTYIFKWVVDLNREQEHF